jgi:hypothetical protein
MKRFHRWLFNGAAAISLLLCLATILLWIISYFSHIALNWADHSISYDLGCSRGEMSTSRVHWASPVPAANAGWSLALLKPASLLDSYEKLTGIIGQFRFRFFGFAFFSLHRPAVMDGPKFFWPCWVLVLLTAMPPAIWIRKHRPPKPGLCPVCGYDLRATPNQCPECGAIPPKKEVISN